MANTAQQEKVYSIAEYFALEEQSVQKQEFHNGKITPMAGASFAHNTIQANIIFALMDWIRKNNLNYLVVGSDTKVRIEQYNKMVYPDAVLICEKPQYYKNRTDTILNPVLIVEVLSTGTRKYDEDGKFKLYRSIPSFKEYLLVEQNEPSIDAFFHEDSANSLWKITAARQLKESIKLHSIGYDLPLNLVYRQIPELLGKDWKG